MENDEHIVSYTADELAAMRARGEGRTDWARLNAMTEEEIEASIDHDEEGEIDWSTGMAGIPLPKRPLTVELDGDIIDWFEAQDGDYQRQINTVLRRHVEAEKRQRREQERARETVAPH